MTQVKIGIIGCMGRMGKALTSEVLGSKDAILVGGTEMPDHSLIGENIKHPLTGEPTDIILTSDAEALIKSADVILDFTCPTATLMHASLAQKYKTAMVVGTTGLSIEDENQLKNEASECAIVYSSNYSLGVNLLFHLTRKASSILGEDFDIEINETHHRDKIDAPSGTALSLGKEAAGGRHKNLDTLMIGERFGIGSARKKGGIGFSSMRGGNIAGQHSVNFIADNESVVLSHIATDRSIFARGAITAALWVSGKSPALYDMADVLGLKND